MKNLVSGSVAITAEVMTPPLYATYGGLLVTPRTGNDPKNAIALGASWALDNDCFNRFDVSAIFTMMERYKGLLGCLFMVAPDVVGDAQDTLIRFAWWEPIIRQYGYPVALALQNGQQDYDIPWQKLDAIFIGGDNRFKLSAYTSRIVAEANRRKKHVHMGRVNSNKRMLYAASIGCDSVDGSGYARFIRDKVVDALPYQMNIQRRLIA